MCKRVYLWELILVFSITLNVNSADIFKTKDIYDSDSMYGTRYEPPPETYYEVYYYAKYFTVFQDEDHLDRITITFKGEGYSINEANSRNNPPFDDDEQWIKLILTIQGSGKPSIIWENDIEDKQQYVEEIKLEDSNDYNHTRGSDEFQYTYINYSSQIQYLTIKFKIEAMACAGDDSSRIVSDLWVLNYQFIVNPADEKLVINKNYLDFGSGTNSLNLKVENDGGGELDWDSHKSADEWFNYSPTFWNDLLHNEYNTITVLVDRADIPQDELQNPHHYGKITIHDDSIEDTVQVKASLTIPSKPQNLTISGDQMEHPVLNWNDVPLTYRYKVERKNITLATSWIEIAVVSDSYYIDTDITISSLFGDEYEYRVRAINGAGLSYYSESVSTEGYLYQESNLGGPQILIPDLPKKYSLENSYPNPGNPGTTVLFRLPEENHLVLKVFNVRGEVVRTLIDQRMIAGQHEIYWDGCNEQGNSVVTGMYIFMMKAGSQVFHKKFSLIK